MIEKLIITILILVSFNCNSQTIKTIEKIESSYKNCLDQGENMKGCSSEYYKKSDSLLNVVYKKLKFRLSIIQQSKLKKEQLEWLSMRNTYFRKIYSEEKKEGVFEEGSNDFEMIINDKKANFVFERVKLLIKRI
ncbi:MAG: DUF1311 domain-containing protein [Flavobacterium sp.]|nr:DUF1311 domain-containing protein [Flavobacterium sp.]